VSQTERAHETIGPFWKAGCNLQYRLGRNTYHPVVYVMVDPNRSTSTSQTQVASGGAASYGREVNNRGRSSYARADRTCFFLTR
jgi:hypothetical protein